MNDKIYTPRYTHGTAIEATIQEIDRNRWLIDNMLLMPKHEAWIRREVTVRRASGTTRIEGATLDEEAVSELLRKNPSGRVGDDEQANLNAIRAYETIDYLSDHADLPVDELIIRQLNREFLYGASAVLTPGVYRKGENKVSNYIPPNQGDVPALMREFALWLRSDAEVHPVLKAGIAHIHLVAIHPFWDGNGRTARGLSTLILQKSPFSFKKLLSLEASMFRIRDDYFTAIERTLGDHFQSEYDSTPWLGFFTDTLLTHTRELVAKLTDWHREMTDVYKTLEGFDVNQRQSEGLMYAVRMGRLTRPDYVEVTGASPITASRDLAWLVQKGLLEPQGNTRARVYFPTFRGILDREAAPEPSAEQLPLIK